MCGKYALQRLQIFHIVLPAEIAICSRIVAISIHLIQKYRKFANFTRLCFPFLQHFATKFWNFNILVYQGCIGLVGTTLQEV